MKRLVSIILLFGLLTQVFSKEIIFAEYIINKKFIASTLCVKKEIADNDCQGKCHLIKELAKDDDQDKAPASKSKSGTETIWDLTSPLRLSFVQFFSSQEYSNYSIEIHSGIDFDIFHPPGC